MFVIKDNDSFLSKYSISSERNFYYQFANESLAYCFKDIELATFVLNKLIQEGNTVLSIVEKEKIPSWKQIFNTNAFSMPGDHIRKIIEKTREIGYAYFVFNGLIYTAEGKETLWKESDIGE